jgi:hypothetical protein
MLCPLNVLVCLWTQPLSPTLIKKKIKFSSYIRKFIGIGCKVIYDERPPHIWLNICAFPRILGSPSSYMTWHPIHSEFPYICEENLISFLSVHPLSVPVITQKRQLIGGPSPARRLIAGLLKEKKGFYLASLSISPPLMRLYPYLSPGPMHRYSHTFLASPTPTHPNPPTESTQMKIPPFSDAAFDGDGICGPAC